MKRIILLFIVILITLSSLNSKEFQEIIKINIDTEELSKKINYHSTQFFTRNNQKSDYIYTFNIYDIIMLYLKDLSKSDFDKLIFLFKNNDNQTVLATFNEFDNNNSQLQAYLTFKKVTAKTGDKISIDESKGDLDLQELDENITHFTTRHRIGLQLETIDKSIQSLLLSNSCLIFPKDLTTKRWLKNVTEIIIYKID